MGALFIRTAVLVLWPMAPHVALGQSAPAPLPPAAQDALGRGIVAARLPDYPLAIRYFGEARTLAPQAPMVFLNLGLAESRIPGRELRAIAWFGAYLAAYPDAPNAAAVTEQMDMLDVKTQSNLGGLVKSVQEMAGNLSNDNSEKTLSRVAGLQAASGDLAGAQATVRRIRGPYEQTNGLSSIADAQLQAGDLAGAQASLAAARKSVAIVPEADRLRAQTYLVDPVDWKLVQVQVARGDAVGAQITTAGIVDAFYHRHAQSAVADAQIRGGDLEGAKATLSSAEQTTRSIPEEKYRISAFAQIEGARKAIAAAAAKGSVAPIVAKSVAAPTVAPTVAEWLARLDDADDKNEGALNTTPFLDVAGFLKAVPAGDDPQKSLEWLLENVGTMARAHNVIVLMRKRT